MNPGLKGVDIVHEIKSRTHLPFKSNVFDNVYLLDVVEHVQDIAWLLSEVHRVATPNAQVDIQYPHFSGRNAYGDVMHHHYLGLDAFNHFIPETQEGQKYQYYSLFGRHFPFDLQNKGVTFKMGEMCRLPYNLFGEGTYESSLSALLPIATVNLELKVVKD
jgi:ubiquinone/menaquinone biosynthesis C-methylase UbiE